MTDQLLIRTVDHLEDIFRAVQYREERRRLLEEICKPLHLPLLLALRQNGVRGFCADHESSADFSIRGINGTIAVSPVDVFQPAISTNGHEGVLVPAWLAPRHDRLDLRANDRPD